MSRSRFLLALLWLAAAGMGRLGAQEEPPPAGRPAQFSGLVGQYALEVTAAPTTVQVEEPVVLRVRITGRGPERFQPRREHLRLFPADFASDFYVEPLPAEDRSEPGRWEFVYRLRPKHEGIQAIAGLKLIYYDPARRRYQTAYPEGDVPLSVKARVETRTDWEVAAGPVAPGFYTLAPLDPYASAAPQRLPPLEWLVLLALAPPVFCWLGYRLARRWTSRPASLPSSRAAQQALKELDAGTAPAWVVLQVYLRDRLGYPGAELTPADTARFLKRRGLPRSLCARARIFLAACDAVRFTASGAASASGLRDDAMQLIQALEADKCLA